MKAVIMAGGKGTRLRSVNCTIPKPMFPILGKPILQYQIESLKESLITDITLVIGHLGESIKKYFGDGKKFGVKIDYLIETEPLGTAGALFYLKKYVKEDFFLLFGDLMLDIDWNKFMSFHKSNNSFITLFGHPNSHPFDSDILICDKSNRLIGILPKNSPRDEFYHNLVNAGVYCISPMVLDSIVQIQKLDLEKDLISKKLDQNNIFVYSSSEYVKDMGTPDRFDSVTKDCLEDMVSRKNYKRKQKAIFLDRDGTINVLRGFLKQTSDFELLPNVTKAIKLINSSPFLAIVCTNQPVIARGDCSLSELDNIHKKMETLLGQDGAYIDDLFFCPHHPDKGFPGEITSLKIECSCRKPKIGMVLEAARKHNIDLEASWCIGDTTVDIQTGKNAGMHTCLLLTGESGQDRKYNAKPDFVANDLLAAVKKIVGFERGED